MVLVPTRDFSQDGQVGKSNSATSTQVLNCMSGVHKTSGLELDDVDINTGCGQAMLDLDASDPFIHAKSETVCQWMRERGPSFLDTCVSYEKEVIETSILHPELGEPHGSRQSRRRLRPSSCNSCSPTPSS